MVGSGQIAVFTTTPRLIALWRMAVVSAERRETARRERVYRQCMNEAGRGGAGVRPAHLLFTHAPTTCIG